MIRRLGVSSLAAYFFLKRQNIFHIFHKETHGELCACCVAVASSVISKHDSNRNPEWKGNRSKNPFIDRNVTVTSQSVKLPRWRCYLRQGSSGQHDRKAPTTAHVNTTNQLTDTKVSKCTTAGVSQALPVAQQLRSN